MENITAKAPEVTVLLADLEDLIRRVVSDELAKHRYQEAILYGKPFVTNVKPATSTVIPQTQVVETWI